MADIFFFQLTVWVINSKTIIKKNMTHYNDVLKNPNLKQDDGNWEILSAEELEIFDILVLKKKI